MNKLISANYWFGCDWCICEVGYLSLHASQLSLDRLHPGYPSEDKTRDSTHPRSSGLLETGELGCLVGMVGGEIQNACNSGEWVHAAW